MPRFIYLEMTCKLNQDNYDDRVPLADVTVLPIKDIPLDQLFVCYREAFSQGDAIFYSLQNPEERRRYFDEELGFPDVLENPASFGYRIKDELIDFTLVHPYLENNYQISCMCLLPEYQGRGIGKSMLNRIKNIALTNDCKTLSLGTEPNMRAFQLYQKHGFIVTGEHIVDC